MALVHDLKTTPLSLSVVKMSLAHFCAGAELGLDRKHRQQASIKQKNPARLMGSPSSGTR